MSQFDILEVLEKSKKPMKLLEIKEIVKINKQNVGVNLRKLLKKGRIKKSELSIKGIGGKYSLWSLTERG